MYVFVLSTATLVSIMGLGALLAARTRFSAAVSEENMLQARWCAKAAIQLGLQIMRDDPGWRSNWGPGAWISNEVVGRGRCSLSAAEIADGDANPINNTWMLSAEGVCDGATHHLQVELHDGVELLQWRQVVK
jgi:hypothetical protein